MNLDAQMMVSIFEAGKDFSRVMHLADSYGRVVILKDINNFEPVSFQELVENNAKFKAAHSPVRSLNNL